MYGGGLNDPRRGDSAGIFVHTGAMQYSIYNAGVEPATLTANQQVLWLHYAWPNGVILVIRPSEYGLPLDSNNTPADKSMMAERFARLTHALDQVEPQGNA